MQKALSFFLSLVISIALAGVFLMCIGGITEQIRTTLWLPQWFGANVLIAFIVPWGTAYYYYESKNNIRKARSSPQWVFYLTLSVILNLLAQFGLLSTSLNSADYFIQGGGVAAYLCWLGIFINGVVFTLSSKFLRTGTNAENIPNWLP